MDSQNGRYETFHAISGFKETSELEAVTVNNITDDNKKKYTEENTALVITDDS